MHLVIWNSIFDRNIGSLIFHHLQELV